MYRGWMGVPRVVRVGSAVLLLGAARGLAEPPAPALAAELDARRLAGKAHYENDDFAEAAAEFRRCMELAPESAIDRFNLGLTLMRAQKHDEAVAALAEALKLDPDLLAAHYIRGIILKRQNNFGDAVEALTLVAARDPKCSAAFYNLGVCYKFLEQYEQAVEAFNKAAALSPTDPSTHYQLITLYRRLGQVEPVTRHKEIYDQVKDTVDESEKTAEALERSKYSYIIEAPRLTSETSPQPDAPVRFAEATEAFGLPKPGTFGPAREQLLSSRRPNPVTDPTEIMRRYEGPLSGSGVALADYDGDGDLDIYIVNASTDDKEAANRLYRNEGNGRFIDVTAAAGVGDTGMGRDAVFGDCDNDGHTDLYVINCGPNVLYRNMGDGTFEDVSQRARANEPQYGRRALFLDYDHDGDLDIFVANDTDFTLVGEAGPGTATGTEPARPVPGNMIRRLDDFAGQSNTLLRNCGDGTFSDLTDEAGLLVGFARTQDALAADFDGDHDLDLFYVNADGPAEFFVNDRFGRFVQGGSFAPTVDAGGQAVVEGDFDRDGDLDLVVAAHGAGSHGNTLARFDNDGQARFRGTPVPTADGLPTERITVFDFNNDGWLDLLLDNGRPRLLAGTGNGEFRDVTDAVGLATGPDDGGFAFLADFAAGDLDADGDEDVVVHTRDKGPIVLRNDGGNRNNWLDVKLVGKKVNRSGYGATVEMAAPGYYQKQTYNKGWAHFGLGELKQVDVVRVTWPNGMAQNVIRPQINQTLTVEERVKVSASCGFLYAHNGTGYELVNEILGVGPLGVPRGPGVYHQPDCTELTKIEPGRLVARDGVYELRLTEELRETMYADRIALRAVDHPADLEIIPNEYFTAPPFPEDRFCAVAEHRPPVSAVEDRGRDVLADVLERDGQVVTFDLTPYDGLAQAHSLTLDLGDLSEAPTVLLFLDGWICWPESSTVMAIAQDPRYEITPLRLEVRDEGGQWQTAVGSVGLPTSKGLVVPVDLTNRFPADDYHVRLSTTLCVYFDRIFVSTADEAGRCRQTELPVAEADLHYRGFSAMTRDELGYERFDYSQVSPTGSWSPPQGMLTRYGDVTPLLNEADDQYVIFGPGDELGLRFDATALPGLPPGWRRSFVFYANGWVKDGDLNTKFSQTVEPLPFHGMSGYPYPAGEHYPDTPALREYRRRYNTRAAEPTTGELNREGALEP